MITDILQPTHLIFILVVALLVLGPKRLPEAGRALGSGLKSFRGAMSGLESEAQNIFNDEPSQDAAPEPTIVEPAVVVEPDGHVVNSATDEPQAPVAVAPATVIAPTVAAPTVASAPSPPTVVSATSRASETD